MPAVVTRSWGTRWLWKVFFSGVALVFFIGASPLGVAVGTEPTGLRTRVGLFALGGMMLLLAHRTRIQLTSDAVILRNLFTTSVVPLDDIIRVEPRRGGLWFEQRRGRDSEAAFIGEAGLLTQALGRQTRGHDIAAVITEAMAVHGLQGDG